MNYKGRLIAQVSLEELGGHLEQFDVLDSAMAFEEPKKHHTFHTTAWHTTPIAFMVRSGSKVLFQTHPHNFYVWEEYD